MKDCPSYPILHLPDYGIDLNFPLTRIRIGNKADCHIALARREKNDFWASINSVGEKWRLVIKGRIWLNERLYSDESGDLLLKNGDMLRIGALRLQFLTDLSEESESVDREVLQIPDVDDSFEVATESLRIVKPSVVFTIASAKRFTIHISTIAFIILTSYWLATGKALVVRSYLSQKFPASQKDNTKPIARKSISSLIKKPFEKKTPMSKQSAPAYNIFDAFSSWLFRCDLSLRLVYKPSKKGVLLWAEQTKLRREQSELFAQMRKGKLVEAEILYTQKIYPKLYSSVKGMENAIKYNGWAIRLLRLNEEWQASKDPKLRQQLQKELEILRMQTKLYVKSPANKRAFRRLCDCITRKLRQAE